MKQNGSSFVRAGEHSRKARRKRGFSISLNLGEISLSAYDEKLGFRPMALMWEWLKD